MLTDGTRVIGYTFTSSDVIVLVRVAQSVEQTPPVRYWVSLETARQFRWNCSGHLGLRFESWPLLGLLRSTMSLT